MTRAGEREVVKAEHVNGGARLHFERGADRGRSAWRTL